MTPALGIVHVTRNGDNRVNEVSYWVGNEQ